MEVLNNFATSATTTLMDWAGAMSVPAQEATAKAASSGQDLWFSFLGIDWSTPTWDLVILLFFILSVLIYSFTLGRDRIVAIMISTYISLAVTTNLPFMQDLTEMINSFGRLTFQISSFLIVFVLLFFMLSRGKVIQGFSNLSGTWWQIMVFALLQVGLMASIIMSFLPEVALEHFSNYTKTIFVSDIGKFVWLVLPILALAFFKSGSSYPRRRWGRRSRFDFS